MGTDQSATRDTEGLRYVLPGLQSGMLACFVMLLWLGLASRWFRHGFWRTSDVLAMSLFGSGALRAGFGFSTVSGIALHLLIYSLFGALFAWMVRDRLRPMYLFVAGIASAVACYYFMFFVVWPRINPLIELYTHDRPMLLGHVVYGSLMSRYGRFLRS